MVFVPGLLPASENTNPTPQSFESMQKVVSPRMAALARQGAEKQAGAGTKDAREEGLFRRAGRSDLRRRILNSLKKGERPHLDDNNVALECAAALQLFLGHLKKPVMPQHVQQLLLADNPGVTAHVIARDAWGLIRQDVGGRHGELLAGLLDLLRHLTLSGPPSERTELRGSPLPIALLPVFFTLTPADLVKWKQVAARFSELITEAPVQLQLNENRSHGVESMGGSSGNSVGTIRNQATVTV